MAKTSGLDATSCGTVFPPSRPARTIAKVSRAYTREQAAHTSARRFPHGR
nr:hypothetical protein [uncultured Cellulomonas sp.]